MPYIHLAYSDTSDKGSVVEGSRVLFTSRKEALPSLRESLEMKQKMDFKRSLRLLEVIQ